MNLKKAISLFFIILGMMIFSGCRNTDSSSIPDAPVNLRLNLSINYITFRAPLQYLIFENRDEKVGAYYVGYGGVLVNININSEYCAFDMCCPFEKNKEIKVYPNETGGSAICKKCGSEFDLVYGYGQVSKGPAEENLKRYTTVVRLLNGVQTLIITQ